MVCLYKELANVDAAKDPYCAFTIAGGCLYDSTFQSQLCMVTPNDILCHFALTHNVVESISCPHIHVLLLNRVSLPSALFATHHNNNLNAGLIYIRWLQDVPCDDMPIQQ